MRTVLQLARWLASTATAGQPSARAVLVTGDAVNALGTTQTTSRACASKRCPGRSRQYSEAAAQSSSDASRKPRAGGAGFGFRTRFKDMDSGELSKLLKTAQEPRPRAGPVKLDRLTPAYHTGLHVSQWTKLDTRIEAPYSMEADVKRDMFAVAECGSSQFKGVVHCPRSFTLSGSRWRDIV
jgi:hypothetical protein